MKQHPHLFLHLTPPLNHKVQDQNLEVSGVTMMGSLKNHRLKSQEKRHRPTQILTGILKYRIRWAKPVHQYHDPLHCLHHPLLNLHLPHPLLNLHLPHLHHPLPHLHHPLPHLHHPLPHLHLLQVQNGAKEFQVGHAVFTRWEREVILK